MRTTSWLVALQCGLLLLSAVTAQPKPSPSPSPSPTLSPAPAQSPGPTLDSTLDSLIPFTVGPSPGANPKNYPVKPSIPVDMTGFTFNHTDLSSNAEFLVGVSLFEPVYWKMNESLAKACEYVKAAGAKGVKLLIFPEAAISGYPWFNWWARTWDMETNEQINQLFIENSPMLGPGGGDLRPIMQCAKEARVNLALPINERDNKGSQAAIFNTLVFIDLNGNIVGRHRKTVPSYTERMWWTYGNGDDLIVVDMPEVGRVCGLLCWENYMTLAKYTLMMQGCEFWVAPTQDIGPHSAATMQGIAREARAYLLSTTQMFRPDIVAKSEIGMKGGSGMPFSFNWTGALIDTFHALRESAQNPDGVDKEYMMDGQALVADPDGYLLAGPVYAAGNYAANNGYYSLDWARDGCPPLFRGQAEHRTNCSVIELSGTNIRTDREAIITARVSRGIVQQKKLYMDAVGNYARPDIWSFTWHNKPRDVAFTDSPMADNGKGLYQYDIDGKPYSNGQRTSNVITLDDGTELP